MRNRQLALIMICLTMVFLILCICVNSIVLVLSSRHFTTALSLVTGKTPLAETADSTTSHTPSLLSPQEDTKVPFEVSTVGKNHLMIGTLMGHFTIHRETIEVTIEQGEVYFVPQVASDYKFTDIAVSVISTPNGKSNVVSSSLPIPITMAPSPDRKYTLNKMTFSIPRTEIAKDEPHWLFFELYSKANGDFSKEKSFSPMEDWKHQFYLPPRQ